MVHELAAFERSAHECQMTEDQLHAALFARDVSDRVMVMADGRVLELGPSEQVMTAPTHERTKKFLRAVLDR